MSWPKLIKIPPYPSQSYGEHKGGALSAEESRVVASLARGRPELITKVLAIFMRIVSNWYVKAARKRGIVGKTGAVTFVQKFGGAINANFFVLRTASDRFR